MKCVANVCTLTKWLESSGEKSALLQSSPAPFIFPAARSYDLGFPMTCSQAAAAQSWTVPGAP